ncbi:MAG: esterase [Microbacteriaceae bacterium]|nr:esterase [Microbacteriaceae bacterium]
MAETETLAHSKESLALAAFYTQWGEEAVANATGGLNPLTLLRYQYDSWTKHATEPSGVQYENLETDGVTGIWERPTGAAADRVILYFHGGGYIGGSASGHRKLVGHIAKAAGVDALSIDYRFAPEVPFPAQLDDALVAYHWLLAHGYTPSQIVLAGDSAGGALATAVGLKLRDAGDELPAAIVTLSPFYDTEGVGDAFDFNAGNDVMGNREALAGLSSMLLTEGGSMKDPFLSALNSDPTGLPPIYISFGGHEVLKDGGTLFTTLARSKGVDVEYVESPGQQHVFEALAGRSPEADASIASIGKYIRKHLQLS